MAKRECGRCKSNPEENIQRMEELFLRAGTLRMNRIYPDKMNEDGITTEHILWDEDRRYYYLKPNMESKDEMRIFYSATAGTGYRYFASISLDDTDEQLLEEIKQIIHGWTPEERELLQRYIRLDWMEEEQMNMPDELEEEDSEASFHQEELDLEYEFEIDQGMDELYQAYEEKFNEDQPAAALGFLQILDCRVKSGLGVFHGNHFALQQKMLHEFYEFFTEEERIGMAKSIYQYCDREYGAFNPLTIQSILDMKTMLASYSYKKENVLLGEAVCKLFQMKYGEHSRIYYQGVENMMFDYRRVGHIIKAKKCAIACLEYYEEQDEWQGIAYFTYFLALLCRESEGMDLEKARDLFLYVYDLLLEYLDPSEDVFLEIRNQIAITYREMEHFDAALQTQRGVIQEALEKNGAEDETTIQYVFNLSLIYDEMEAKEQRFLVDQPLYEHCQKTFGDDHPHTLNAIEAVIMDMADLGELKTATKLAKHEYRRRIQSLGKNHPMTVEMMWLYEALEEEVNEADERE